MKQLQESQNLILEGLNPPQKEAVLHGNGPLLIIAGAGSGKTRVLTHRLASLIAKGVPTREILALTFTNKAAGEMARRASKLVGLANEAGKAGEVSKESLAGSLPFIGTFHSLCARILREHPHHLGYRKNFTIFDEDESLAAMKEALKRLDIPKEKISPGAACSFISKMKNGGLGPENIGERTEFADSIKLVWHEYENSLKAQNALDFDNLLLKTLELFETRQEVLKKYQTQFHHILVDEYQDTNKPQYLLVKQLAGAHKNLCVVGDDWQSVYAFRGADFRNILLFEKDWPDARVIFLEENYRSTQRILDAAHHVITKNNYRTEKKLWTKNQTGEPIFIVGLRDEYDEAHFVADTVLEHRHHGHSLAHCAVLFRTNAQSRALEEAFIEKGLPYQLIGGFKFYKRREVQDVLAYLKVIANPHDRISFLRCVNTPPRGIG
ncbi:MAG: UvrD-helicase domain-containing protein, partial [Parcubacteria group bacterium]|nr:UvrD-helicase domain-containing protein [Parcubacteria group bacterium]